MKILFIGGLFPNERIKEFTSKSKGVIQFAANAFQWSFIKGLDLFFKDVNIYTAPLLGNFPRTYKRIYSKNSEFSHNNVNRDYCIGYLQIPLICLISKSVNIYRSLKKNEKSENPYILVYCVHTPFLLAAIRFKKKHPDSKVCLIVPDLPEYMSSKSGFWYTLLKKIDLLLINSLIKKVDSFVFSTDLMATHFNVGNRPWIRIEGMFDQDEKLEDVVINKSKEKIILYTGTLDSRYGILDLIEAFKLIPDPDYVFWICGDGNMRKYVTDYAKTDLRLKYYGQVSRSEALNFQKKATLLVNPRTSKGEYTKYSFPSKTMEYLASGKPCIMNHLPGTPQEYLSHLFIPENETPLGLSRKIVEVIEMDKEALNDHCKKSVEFIFKEKNPASQIVKLNEMLRINHTHE
jgi:glycosyltransferase involved in cell wall biosynthesis